MLALHGLTRSFGDVRALDGVGFTAEPGQVVGFVGSNGAGKTTTMRVVMGLLRPDAGEVHWRGQPVTADDRRRFGYMPEERGLYPRMRVGDQLVYLARLHGRSRRDAEAATTEWLERFGLAERRREPLEKLSLGNQQRVQLAASLVHEPDLLMLDEPFSGLDPVGVDEVSRALQQYSSRGVPVLFSSHQLDLVERLCDTLVVIHAGRLVASGSVEALVREGAERQRSVRVQVATTDAGATAATVLTGTPGVSVVTENRDAEGLEIVARIAGDAPVEPTGQAVLRAAQAAGTVRSFGEVRPRLSEIYREAVSR